jgi:hypothetical protein
MSMPDILLLIILLIVLAVVVSVFVFQAITGVPAMSSGRAEIADVVALLKEAHLPDDAIIYELGCAWGTLVMGLAEAFPQAQIRGIELSPFPYWIARFRTRTLSNVFLQRGNFYKVDLSDANVVTCYLMMKPMLKLVDYLDTMLKPGTPVVSLTFWFRGREVSARRTGPGIRGEVALYYWPANQLSSHVAPKTTNEITHANLNLQ